MSLTIRAQVIRTPRQGYSGLWAVRVVQSLPAHPGVGYAGKSQYAWTWPEAMQLAYKMLADADAELMNDVHASRSARREAKSLITTQEPTA